ncbi:MAG TPA: MaoC family dehydratase [Bryobacteraceae bacterium]|jgi:acyl dehydratase
MPHKVIRGLDELKASIGVEAGVSDWYEVTQERIQMFADATGDHQWIHLDRERAARESPFHTTIAHGFLTVSLLPMLLKQAVEVDVNAKLSVNYGFNKLRFVSPVPSGSRIRVRVTPNAVKEVEGGVEIVWGIIVEIEGGGTKPAVAAEWLGRLYF